MEFERLIAFYDVDLGPFEKKSKQAEKIISDLEKKIKAMKWSMGDGKGVSAIDREMDRARASIKRMEAERIRGEKSVTAAVEREARAQSRAREREYKRSMNAMIADSRKRERNEARNNAVTNSNRSGFVGGLAGAGMVAGFLGLGSSLTSIVTEGREAYTTLEKLVRFTATLDRSFQSPEALRKFQADIEKLSLEVPQTAQSIAEASFTIKSAYQKMTEPELIAFLRNMSMAATASNATVAEHTQRVIALASSYGITAKELDHFNALIATSFGQALAVDSQVGDGFNQILLSAKAIKQPLEQVTAAMGALQSTSSSAAENTVNLQNLLSKLGDGKYIQGLKDTFNVDVFTKDGKWKDLNQIINEIHKSLVGLSEEERTKKIFEVFKDQQARKGLEGLLEKLDLFNTTLRDGADAEVFKNKQATMLNSAEARWILFANRVEVLKRTMGEGVADVVTVPMEFQDPSNRMASLFADQIGANLLTGAVGIGGLISEIGLDLELKALKAFNVISPETAEKIKAQNKAAIEDVLKSLGEQRRADRAVLLGGEVDSFTGPAKEQAKAALTRALADMGPVEIEKLKLQIGPSAFEGLIDDIKDPLFEVYKQAGISAADGLSAGDPEVVKHSAKTLQLVKDEWKRQLDDPKTPIEMKDKIAAMFKLLPDVAVDSIESKAPEVQTATENLANVDGAPFTMSGQDLGLRLGQGTAGGIQSSQGLVDAAAQNALSNTGVDASGPGQTLGQQFAAGMALGIARGEGIVGGAVRGLVNLAFGVGKKEEIARSPSRRAAEELGLPFVQGIEVGIAAGEKSLSNTVSNTIGSMFGPKTKAKVKKETDEMIRNLLASLGDASTRIGAETTRAEQEVRRFYDAILGDETADFNTQIQRIADFYGKVYDLEESAYQRRLKNISDREEAIRKLKKIKPAERERELAKLSDERADVVGDREQGRFDADKNKGAAVLEAINRRVEAAQRELARSLKIGGIGDIGKNLSASTVTETNLANDLKLIDSKIAGLKKERDEAQLTGNALVEINNRIADAEQERSDREAEGQVEREQARQDDLRSAREYARQLADFAGQTVDAQLEAEQAKIELLRSAGATDEQIFQAEIALEMRREVFRHQQRTNEIESQKQSLLTLATTEDERLRIISNANLQYEAEMQRHNSVLQQMSAEQGKFSILGMMRDVANRLPDYLTQLKGFAASVPDALGNIFSSALQQYDGTWKSFLNGLKQAFFDTIKQMLAELFRAQLIKGLVGLFGALAGASASAAPGGISAGNWDAVSGGWYTGSGFAEGGVPPMGRVSVVGENGPELFVPRVAGRILSNEDSKAAISGRGGNTTINQTVVNNIKAPRGIVAKKSIRQASEAAITGLSYAS